MSQATSGHVGLITDYRKYHRVSGIVDVINHYYNLEPYQYTYVVNYAIGYKASVSMAYYITCIV